MVKGNISIFGAGYVGLTSAVLFANSGFKVNLIENDPKRLKILRSGKSFFYEQGIDELLQEALRQKNLSITDQPAVIKNSEVIFSCVGTPDNPDGSSNLSYIYSVAKTISENANDVAVFVQKSTVPVGTGENIELLFKKEQRKIAYVSNPEFLREGTAILDSLWFDRVVVGSNNDSAITKVMSIYEQLEKNKDKIAKIINVEPINKPSGKYIRTNRNSAELIKVTANAFLALKISFANSIAKLADESGADVVDVMDAVGADNRIGRAFLNAGRGYGGGCFPKDVSGLIASASEYGVDMPIMIAVTDINESMPGYIANKAQGELETLENKKVAVLGLAFKAGTSDSRKSPGVKLANILDKSGAKVTAFDPHANIEAGGDLRSSVVVKSSLRDAVTGVDAILIATEWEEFKKLNFKEIADLMSGNLIIDAVNILDPSVIGGFGLNYIGVGRGK